MFNEHNIIHQIGELYIHKNKNIKYIHIYIIILD